MAKIKHSEVNKSEHRWVGVDKGTRNLFLDERRDRVQAYWIVFNSLGIVCMLVFLFALGVPSQQSKPGALADLLWFSGCSTIFSFGLAYFIRKHISLLDFIKRFDKDSVLVGFGVRGGQYYIFVQANGGRKEWPTEHCTKDKIVTLLFDHGIRREEWVSRSMYNNIRYLFLFRWLYENEQDLCIALTK